jgi:hypothetical protein
LGGMAAAPRRERRARAGCLHRPARCAARRRRSGRARESGPLSRFCACAVRSRGPLSALRACYRLGRQTPRPAPRAAAAATRC